MPGQAWRASRSQGLVIEARDRLPVALDVLLEEVLGQQLDVLPALAQRRQVDRDRVEPEEEILAEPAGGDLRRKVGVGGGDEPHVGPDRPRGADPLELAGLERPQDLRLLVRAGCCRSRP